MKTFILVTILLLSLEKQLKAQNISDTLKSLYFNLPVNKLDSSLLERLKAEKRLTYFDVNKTFQLAPSDITDFFYKFFFKEPFILNDDSLSGYLFLHIKKMTDSKSVVSLSVTYDSLNQRRAESLFNNLFKKFYNYYNKSTSELRFGGGSDSKYFDFDRLNLDGDLYLKNRGAIENPYYEVTLSLIPR